MRQAIEQGEIDIVTGMYYTPERDTVVDFSVPHVQVSPGLFVRNGSPIHGLEDIQGREVLVQRDDAMHDYLRQQGTAARIVPVTDPLDALRWLSDGRYDAALLSSQVQGLYLSDEHQLDNLRTIEVGLEPLEYCLAVREGDRELARALNEGLNALKARGRYKEIYDAWFGVYERRSFWYMARYLAWGMGALAALFAVALAWSWMLRRQVQQRTRALELEVADRKRIATALQERERQLALLIDSLPGYVAYMTGDDLRYRFVNRTFAETFGRAQDQIVGMLPSDVIGERNVQFAFPYIQEVRAGRPASYENVFDTERGKRWIQVNYVPDFDAQGQVVGVVLLGFDITERRQQEEALQAYSERLEERVQERTAALQEAQEQLVRREKLAVLGQMAGSVGHELRNPLGVISNAVYFLKLVLPNADDTVREYLDMIAAEVHNSERIVADLLGFARVRKVDLEDTSVAALVTQTLAVCPAPENVHVDTRLSPDLPKVLVDARQMVQVLANLVTNAYEAMPEGGTLTIDGRADTGEVAIAVTDTGHGIAPEHMDRLFEPLFSTKQRGIGLGLAICKSLVEVNDGRIEVWSEPGQGSAFVVWLPVAPDR